MAKDHRIETLMEAHLSEVKAINEGMRSVLTVQEEMRDELKGLRPIKEEWPVVKMTIKNISKDVQETKKKVDDLDTKVAKILPDHEKRITKVENEIVLAKR
jgi:archaellum component FlaC